MTMEQDSPNRQEPALSALERVNRARQELDRAASLSTPDRADRIRKARRELSDAYLRSFTPVMSDADRMTLLNWATLDASIALASLADLGAS